MIIIELKMCKKRMDIFDVEYMLDTLNQDLSQKMIKHFHYELKSGVFEDRANGYAIGEYKERPNIISNVNILWDKNKD